MADVFIPLNETKDPWGLREGLEFSRDPERTPMQWSCTPNAGFCTECTPWLPLASDYCTVNVEAQQASRSSMLRVLTATLAMRRRSPALLAGGQNIFLADDASGLLAYSRSATGAATAVVVMNWGRARVVADVSRGFEGVGYAALSTADGEYTDPRAIDMSAVAVDPGEGLLLFSSI